jgi:hypothetical protein
MEQQLEPWTVVSVSGCRPSINIRLFVSGILVQEITESLRLSEFLIWQIVPLCS